MDINKIINECTSVEFKRELSSNPGSYLKTVSAFSNGGETGYLIFGLTDDKIPFDINIEETQMKVVDQISKKIEPSIIPKTDVIRYKDKDILVITIFPGAQTPYYSKEANKAYIRNGNQSIEAPRDIMNNLILRGMNMTWDDVVSDVNVGELTFKSLQEKLVERGQIYNDNTLVNFSLVKDGKCKRAALLLSDQNPIVDSYINCIRFKGLSRGTTEFIDKKEFRGSIIKQIDDAIMFIKNNTKTQASISGVTREDLEEYKIVAIREAVINAVVHRDYSKLGTQVDVFLFDDRIEISSNGSPITGDTIEEIAKMETILSERRNRGIADIFSRIGLMERSGTGLTRIRESYADYPDKVKFRQNKDHVHVIFGSLTYVEPKYIDYSLLNETQIKVLELCKDEPKGTQELVDELGLTSKNSFVNKNINPLVELGYLERTIKDKINSKNQKYISIVDNN